MGILEFEESYSNSKDLLLMPWVEVHTQRGRFPFYPGAC